MYVALPSHTKLRPPGLGMIDPVTAAVTIKGAVSVIKALSNLFGGKLTYGLKAEEFSQRWSNPRWFRAQWMANAQPGAADGKGSWWFDPNEQGGAGVAERAQNTTAQGMTLADYYVVLCQGTGLDGLQALHELYLDTASLVPSGFKGRGDFVSRMRDGKLSKYLPDYLERFGDAASPYAGSMTAAQQAAAAAKSVGQSVFTAGGMPLLLGLVVLGGFFLTKSKGR